MERKIDVDAVRYLINLITNLPNNPAGDRKGGFFAVYETSSKQMVVQKFGNPLLEKESQYLRNATEKVTRLVKTNEFRSFESRNEQLEHWGGGISYGGVVCAFSGFPEDLDEALSMTYAIHINTLHLKDNLRSDFFYDIPWHKGFVSLKKENPFFNTIAHAFNHGFSKKLD